MDDDFHDKTAHHVPSSEWPEPKRERSAPTPLPHSNDKEFWGDAKITVVSKDEIDKRVQEYLAKINGTHTIRQMGREFVCTSCDNSHTLPIDPNVYTMDTTGRVVPIDRAN